MLLYLWFFFVEPLFSLYFGIEPQIPGLRPNHFFLSKYRDDNIIYIVNLVCDDNMIYVMNSVWTLSHVRTKNTGLCTKCDSSSGVWGPLWEMVLNSSPLIPHICVSEVGKQWFR